MKLSGRWCRVHLLAPLLACMALVACAPPQPGLVKVGRGEIALPPGDWVELGMSDETLPAQIALPAGTPVQTRAMGLRGPKQEMLAVLLVQTNRGNVGWSRTLFDGACPDERNVFVEDRAGASPVRIDCLRYKRWADDNDWLAKRQGAVARWMQERGIALNKPYSHMSFRYTTETGSYIAVTAVVDQRLLVPRTRNNEEFLRAGQPAQGWIHQVADAARLSVGLLDGRFTVPPFPIPQPTSN